MSEMAKTLRAKMRDKAKAMSSQKDEKVDSSDWSPAEPINADVKTGMRPISRRAYKTGGKVMGESCAPRADRKPRKKGGKVESEKAEAKAYANAKVNRDAKAANEEREGVKHVGALKKGGVVKKADGGPADMAPGASSGTATKKPENVYRPGYDKEAVDKAISSSRQKIGGKEAAAIHGLLKGRTGKMGGGLTAGVLGGLGPAALAGAFDGKDEKDGKKRGGRAGREEGGRAQARQSNQTTTEEYRRELESRQNPQKAPAPTAPQPKDLYDKDQLKRLERGYEKGGRAKRKDGGKVNYGPMEMPDGKKGASEKEQRSTEEHQRNLSNAKRGKAQQYADGGYLKFKGEPVIPGMKKGGKAQPERMARKAGGRAKKGGTNVNIMIQTKPAPAMGGAPMGDMPMPKPPGGLPVPMPPAGAPPMPMGGIPLPPPAPPLGGGLPGGMPPMARKAGGRITKVAKSYKDMEAGSGGAEGRLQKTDIAKTGKSAPTYKKGGKVYASFKDMDAGAGSGEGRLEKTEIQKRAH